MQSLTDYWDLMPLEEHDILFFLSPSLFFLFCIIQYYWTVMQDRGRLEVNINSRKNIARNSFNSFNSSQGSVSNQFIQSQYNDTERQSGLRNNLQRPSVENYNKKEQLSLGKAKGEPINQISDKIKPKNNPKLQVIREEKVDLRNKIQEKSKVKGSSFQQTPPQPLNKPKDLGKNKSQMPFQKRQQSKVRIQGQQSKKIEEINKNRQKLSSNINTLKEHYQQLQKQEQEVKKRKQNRLNQNPFGIMFSGEKERQVLQFLTLKQLEKKKRRKILEDIAMKQQHKQKLEQREQQMLRERERKRKLKELKRYSQFQDKHIQAKEQAQQREQKAQQFIKKYEGTVGYHIKAKQKQEQTIQKIKKKQEQFLKERKDYYKSLDISEVIEHQRWHDDKIDQLNYERMHQRQQQQQRIAEENDKINDLWRGQAFTIIQTELNDLKKKKRQPKQKLRRIKQYRQHIKNNFSPRTYQYKSLQSPIKQRASNSHREVRRYRYYKGSAVGEVKEEMLLPKSYKEKRQLGDNYLQFVKSLPKKPQPAKEEQLHLQLQDLQILQRKFNGVGKVKRNVPSLYDDGRKKKASLQIVKGVKRDQLQMIVLQLKATDEKLHNKQFLLNQREYGNVNNVQGVQREINQGFVENIDRKLTLLAQL